MSASDKQGFYEIQLNNRHLIGAFVAAVVLGVVVFGLGVMVGREHAPMVVEDGGWVEEGLAEGDAPTEDAEAMDRLEFYDKVEEPTADAAGDATSSPPSDRHPEERDDGGATADRAGPDLPAPDPSLSEGWVVQVKSSTERTTADDLQESLAETGYPAFVISADVDGTTYFRVRVGRYRTEADARAVARALSGRGDIESTWVTRG